MRGARAWAGTLAVVTLLAATPPAPAEQVIVSGKATTVSEQQKALKEAKAQAQRARALSHQLDAKASQATAEADRLNARAAALAARIQESEADLRAGEARIAIINRMIAGQAAHLAEQQGPLIRLTAALQSLSRRPPALALIQPGTLTDTVHARAVFDHVLPVIRERTAAVREELQRLRMLRVVATKADEALRDGRKKLAGQRIELQKLEAQKRLSARGLSSNATLEAEKATAMGERARDIGELMKELETAGSLRDRLALLPGPELRPATPDKAGAPPVETGSATPDEPPAYRLPVVGTLVTGMGEVSDSGVRSRGIGIAAQPGAQVVAPAQGRIAFAGPYRGFGQIVIIDHGAGWSTLITNLGRLSTQVGQQVEQGAPLGVASNGARPVITIELRRQGRPVDIVAIMNARP